MRKRLPLPLCFLVPACAGLTLASFSTAAGAPPIQARHIIIRAPEAEVVDALLRKVPDEEFTAQLWRSVEKGDATVVSDISALAPLGEHVTVTSGSMYKWAVEYDQQPDKPVLTPVAWQEVPIGTSLSAHYAGQSQTPQRLADLNWNASFSPCPPSMVTWPLVWPENRKPEVGEMQQADFHVERVLTSVVATPGGSEIVAVMPPALAPGSDPDPPAMLDVFIAQAVPYGPAPPANPLEAKARQNPRLMVIGIEVKDREALELLAVRDPGQDGALLNSLVEKARQGTAARRILSVLASRTGQHSMLESVREHSYPTEMQTIPSAWGERHVGTSFEVDSSGWSRTFDVSLEHHPAPPRRAVWPCALDAPELIMVQPQFFVQSLRTRVSFAKGTDTMLMAVMRHPDSIAGGEGMVKGQTLLVFGKLDGLPLAPERADEPKRNDGPPDPFAPGGGGPEPEEPYVARLHLETLVFDLPASEEKEWATIPDALDDDVRFQRALKKVKDGTARIAAHIACTTKDGYRVAVQSMEETLYVVECNPAWEEGLIRYRPTALIPEPVGTLWEVEPKIGPSKEPFANGAPEVVLNHKFHHHVRPALQPSLQEVVAFGKAHPNDPLPPAKFFVDEWKGEDRLLPGKARCLGALTPPGEEGKGRVHVAFVRAVVGQ